jgi:lipopolysaccharide transport system ATP-binding protein
MKNVSVDFDNVSKIYSINRMKYGTLSDDLSRIFKFLGRENRSIHKETLWALKGAKFKIQNGECVGIIGKNGSGKSTILKLISKVTYPYKGSVSVNGRVGAFIELGAGLHPELSGRENIFLYGSILGMTKQEITEKFPSIVKFSGIEKFIDTPIKRYSSGMYARLGFSVVAFMDPDILLIDEVLAVGDKPFQDKCMEKMVNFSKSGKTIVFVSHNLEAIKLICNKVIYMQNGRVKKVGNAKHIIDAYLKDLKDDKK